MKRTVVGMALLIVLLAWGIVSAMGLARHNEKVSSLLDAAAAQAMASDLPAAIRTAEEARTVWESGRKISAAFVDHSPLDQIDADFLRLRLYGEAGDNVAFAAVCVELACRIGALGDAHGARWWNIF